MMRLLLPCTALFLLCLLFSPSLAEIAGNPLAGNESYLPPVSIAEDQGLGAIFSNPALLAFHPGEWGLLYYRGIRGFNNNPSLNREFNSHFTANWGLALGGKIALAVDHGHSVAGYDYFDTTPIGELRRPFNRYNLAVSRLLDLHPMDSQLALGAVVRHCRSDAYTLDGFTGFDLGAVFRWRRWLSLGILAHDLNTPTLKGLTPGENRRVNTSYDLAVAIRPGREWLTLSAQSNQQESDGNWIYRTRFGAEIHPWQRLSLRVDLDDRQRISTTIRLSWHNWRGGLNLDDQRANNKGTNYGTYMVEYRNRRFSRAVRSNTRLLHVELSGEIPEYHTEGDQISVQQIIDLTREAATEPDITGILFTLRRPLLGLPHIEEIRRELLSFHRVTGKPVIFYADDFLLEDYYLASAGSEVLINPLGVIWMDGLAMIRPRLGEVLQRQGFKPQLLHQAPNSGTLQMLQPNAQGAEAARIDSTLLAKRLAVIARGIAESRGLDLSSFTRYFNLGPYNAEMARSYHLVDGKIHRDQLADYLKEETGTGKLIPVADFKRADISKKRWGPDKQVAVIHLEGMITRDSSRPGLFGPQCSTTELVAQIDMVRRSSRYIGAVLRINSGGGELIAGDELRRALAALSSVKPLVVSMGNIATGCAFTAALPGRQLLANRSTFTGGLGVIGGKIIQMNSRGDRPISFGEMTTTATPELSPWREYEARDKRKLQGRVDSHYQRLVEDVASRFYISESEVNLLSRGRIMTGAEALGFGMVDKIGGLREAVLAVKRLAGTAPDRQIRSENLPAMKSEVDPHWRRLLFWCNKTDPDRDPSAPTISFWNGNLNYLPPPFDGELMLSYEAFELQLPKTDPVPAAAGGN